MCVVTSVRTLKCSNFRMLVSNIKMIQWLMFWDWPNSGVDSFAYFYLRVVVLFVIKMLVTGKWKYIHKTLREKCQALKNLENGESNNDVAAKYNLPKNTLSSWVKNKQKPFDALKKGINVNPIQDGLSSGLLTLSLKFVSHILQWWNLAQLYLTQRRSKKYMNHVTHPLSSADIIIFSPVLVEV